MISRNGSYDHFGMYDFDNSEEANNLTAQLEAVGADVTVMITNSEGPSFGDVQDHHTYHYLCQWPGPIGMISRKLIEIVYSNMY